MTPRPGVPREARQRGDVAVCELSAEQIVHHHNETLGNLAHPDHAVEVVPVSEVTFGGEPGDG